MTVPSLGLLFVLSLSHQPREPLSQQPQELRWKVLFAGAESGSCRYLAKADGTFEAHTRFSVAGMNVSSDVTGKFAQGKLVEYVLAHEQPGRAAKITFGGGKVEVESEGRTTAAEFSSEYVAVMANLHPQFYATVAEAFDPAKGTKQTIPALLLDGATVLPLVVEAQPPVTYKSDRGTENLQAFKVHVSTVELTFLLDEKRRVVGFDVPSQLFRTELEGYAGAFADPLAKYPELSQPTYKVTWERAVKVPLRDGVETVADVVRPASEGKFPTILVRTPYGRSTAGIQGEWWAKRGYVQVIQDCRGRGDSGGDWVPFENERKDGYDTIDWIVKQPWSDGNVGMIGASYAGYVQWCAAVEGHPALKAIVPQVAPPDLFFNVPYDHGVFFLYGAVWWSHVVRAKEADLSVVAGAPLPNPVKMATLPLSKVDDEVLGVNVPFFDRWLEMDRASAFKAANYYDDLSKVNVPALQISGWWDGDGIGTKRNWARMRELGRKNQWLIYGPWTHAFNSSRQLGDVDYGPEAILELDSLYLRWFDTWLKGKDVGLERIPKVRAFLTGANRWLDLPDWPDPSWKASTLYLSADLPANGPASKGELLEKPARSQEPSRYTYNPAEAYVPEQLSQRQQQNATIEFRIEKYQNDVLLFRTPTLREPLAIAGPISVEVHFSTTGKDVDLFALLLEEDEAGKLRPVGLPGKVRASYLSGWDRPRPLTPGRVYKARIELWDTAHEFGQGKKMVLALMSDMFPLYARNLQTGEPIKDATRMVAAHITLYHDAARPSKLSFMRIPRAATEPASVERETNRAEDPLQ